VMTPSLQQAIKLLQMTRLELQGVVSQELEENPVLEEGDESFEESAAEESGEGTGDEAEPLAEEVGEADSMEDLDLEAFFSEYLDVPTGQPRLEPREAVPLENTLSREPDLYDYLLWQIHMSEIPARQSEIAEIIVGNLDQDGFLVATHEEIRSMNDGEIGGTPYTAEEVDEALEFVRGLDPPGVACSDLRESLLRQLDVLDEPGDSLVRLIIRNHWERFLKRQLQAIARDLGVELADLEPVVETIRGLETRPGRKFSPDRAQYVEPDVHVLRVGNEYVIQLNDDGLPRLRINRAYRTMLRKLKAEKSQTETRNFIKEKLRSAIWLIKSLDQRQRTIYKVAESIVQQQRAFLDHGIDRLRPMVLRDVADDIGMHESTVSRVVSNKYMHTPRGLFPMKFFFHSGIEREYGSDISSLTVKRKIKSLIEAENDQHPLSDSELTRILKREGINIARRTVAKYRDELHIPSSTHRKKIF
jgi:RNA polymerase sigma-54 factor